jgi:hypothetical protein
VTSARDVGAASGAKLLGVNGTSGLDTTGSRPQGGIENAPHNRIAVIAGFAISVILLAAGGLLLWGSTYVHNTVHSQLAAQQI